MKKLLSLLLLFCLSYTGIPDLNGQTLEFPNLDASPMDIAHYPTSSGYRNYLAPDDPNRNSLIKVLYSRPQKKGREVFGVLEPWGKDWRLGANEATEITFANAVEIAGTYVPAGTYTMFAQIFPTQWIIKISKERFIAGAENRDISKDIVAASVPTHATTEVREHFTIGFQKVNDGKVEMIFEWDRTRAKLPINLNPPVMNIADVSPMDLVQYPTRSRMRNYVDAKDLPANEPQIRVLYSRPQMKGRKIFGELIKDGELWRVGANETTTITFFNEVTINNQVFKAGTYGLFIKAGKDTWEFIIHKNAQSWGSANHDEKDNLLKVSSKVEKTPTTVENLSILLIDGAKNTVDMIVAWENSMARLPIQIKATN